MFDNGIIFHSDRKYDPIAKSGTTVVGAYGTLTLLTSGIVGTPRFLVGFEDSNGLTHNNLGGIAFINDVNLWYYSKGPGTCYWRVYGN